MNTQLIRKELVAEETYRFYFTKPDGFGFTAGQSIDLTLVNPPETDTEGNTRAYSLVSAPHELELSIATRMRDTAFKRVLGSLPPGAPLTFEGPFGDFVLHEKVSRPAVILAGGIGITPFYSMITDATHRALPHQIVLLFGNRTKESAPFLSELETLVRKNKNFSFISLIGSRIDADLVRAHVPPHTDPVYYLAGPAPMVRAMRAILHSLSVSGDDVRTEEFTGY